MALGSDLLGRSALRLAVTVMLMPFPLLALILFCLDLNYQSEKDCLIELIGGKSDCGALQSKSWNIESCDKQPHTEAFLMLDWQASWKHCVSTDRKAENSHLTFVASFSADKYTRSLTFPCSLSHSHTHTVAWLYPQGDIHCLEVCCTTNRNLPRVREQNDCTLLYLNISATARVCVLVIQILAYSGADKWFIIFPRFFGWFFLLTSLTKSLITQN